MIDVRPAESDPAYAAFDGFAIPADQLRRQPPDARLLAWDGNRAVARCGLWFRHTPPHASHRVGVIGHYCARPDSADAAAELLRSACARLAGEGCTLAVGPMDGNTWQRYRLVTDRGPEPPFFMEPDNPDDWPDHFRAAGFAPLAQYYSALATDLTVRDSRAVETAVRLAERGISVRNVNLARFEDELRRLHPLLLRCFAGNFLYTPVSEDDFVAQYAPVRAYLRPELVLVAERAGEPVGFLFAVPDLLQLKRAGACDTAIAKTIAVHPDLAGIGLGSYLMDHIHAAMGACGFRRAIHALFHEDNRSGRISRRTAHVIRRYTLFARPLGADA
jgi:GNAT superfamily N-acetyltransferase